MIGRQAIVIDQSNFSRGMSSSKFSSDGGFSPDSKGFSLDSVKGTLTKTPGRTIITSNLNGNILASCPGENVASRYFVTSNNRLQYMNSATTLFDSQAVTGDLTQTGFVDIAQFGNGGTDDPIFISCAQNVIRSVPVSGVPGAPNNTWFSTTFGFNLISGYSHVMLVYENALWIADANFLHKWDGTTASYKALTLPFSQAITSLGIDPSSGLMLIGVKDAQDANGLMPAGSRVLTYDGFSTKPRRSVRVPDVVTSMETLEGTIFMCYGTRFGYWNGAGITFLRDLNITWEATMLVYKHRICVIGKKIFICEGTNVLCYGEITPGTSRVFYYPIATTIDGSGFTIDTLYFNSIFHTGNDNAGQTDGQFLGIQWTGGGTPLISRFNLFKTASSVAFFSFISNYYEFDRLSKIEQILIEYSSGITASLTPGSVSVQDTFGNDIVSGNSVFVTNGKSVSESTFLLNVQMTKPIYGFRFKYKANDQYSAATDIKRFIIYYNKVE